MNWIEVTVKTTSDNIEKLSDKLENFGIEGLSIEDERDFGNFLENNHEYWDYVDEELEEKFKGLAQIKFYLEDNAEGEKKVLELRDKLSEEILEKKVSDSDWENNWKQYYKPMEIGEKIFVIPEWENAEKSDRKRLVGTDIKMGVFLQEMERFLHLLERIVGNGTETRTPQVEPLLFLVINLHKDVIRLLKHAQIRICQMGKDERIP